MKRKVKDLPFPIKLVAPDICLAAEMAPAAFENEFNL